VLVAAGKVIDLLPWTSHPEKGLLLGRAKLTFLFAVSLHCAIAQCPERNSVVLSNS
jgi:hypothetical protein